MNLSSTRIWCYSCEAEILTRNTNSPSPRSSNQMDQKHFSLYNKYSGYHQHDTQEFLRCFMDQLHEELKVYEEDRESVHRLKSLGDQQSSDDEEPEVDGTASSQSDGEYETCDSGVSEQSSLSDEGERGQKRRYSRPNQPDKLRNKFTNRSLKKVSVDVAFLQQQQRSSPNSPTKHRTKKQSKMRSIISDIFDGKLLSSVQCLTCDRVSTRVETFQVLKLKSSYNFLFLMY
ncbi:unnamed protein product [Trichogramma brassicae]|uniref:ubiquitinyl hydrolase 1 n=1 Tax=Trichogramma brassicae TaxID=86971 RepID=A0A6H5IFN4_9HYME|nr:unnamed protein product [Trichogramma brassicae]